MRLRWQQRLAAYARSVRRHQRSLFSMVAVLLVSILSCTQEGSPVQQERPDSWFRGETVIDLTHDGVKDTVLLEAVGPSSDDLLITMTFVVDGKESWREEWSSSYMLIDPPPFPEGEASRSEYIRQQLYSTLNGISVQSFDVATYEMMAYSVDSLMLKSPPPQEILFSYGYESTIVLYWDPASEEFRMSWSCC